jgi:acetyl esterase/lipase
LNVRFAIVVSLLAITGAVRAETRVEHNVIYGMYSGLALLMDVYRPEKPNGRAIVCIQGSGWYAPMRYDAAPITTRPEIVDFAQRLAAAGYTAYTINHRASPRFRFPAQIEDTQRAVRFIRYHAADYGIDAGRIGALGTSSGAHLAELLGSMEGTGEAADSDPVNRVSAKVQAVVAYFGPVDLLSMSLTSTRASAVVSMIGAEYQDPGAKRPMPGRADDAENLLYRDASPLTHVSPGDAPMLLLHGDADTTVPIAQAELMAAALGKAKVEVRLIRVAGGRHGWRFQLPESDSRPAEYWVQALKWFGDHL